MSKAAYRYWSIVIKDVVNESAKMKMNFNSLINSTELGSTFNVTDNFWLKARNTYFIERYRIPYIMLDDVTSLLAAVYHDHGDRVSCFCISSFHSVNIHCYR